MSYVGGYSSRRYGAVGAVPLGGAVGGMGGLGGAGVVPGGGVGVVGGPGYAGGAYGSGVYGSGVYGGPVGGGYVADDGCCGSGGGGMVGGPGFGGVGGRPGFGGGIGGSGGACGTGCGDACAAVGCGGCGTAAGCGSGAGGAILTFVGAGGDYVQETTYRYVGGGAGTFAVVPVGTSANCCLWVIPLGLCLLLLPLLLFLLLGSGTTTTTTTPLITTTPFTPPLIPTTSTLPTTTTPFTPPIIITTPITPPPLVPTSTAVPTTTTIWQGPKRFCIIRGDPHLRTFDGQKASFYSQGEYWIVKSVTVFIQGRYMPTPITHGLSACKEIAIGGPFLGGKILRISALHAFFDGAPILGGFPSQFQHKEPFIKAIYNGEGGLLQPGRGGKPMRVIHLELPLGIFIQVNRWNEPGEGDYINVKITMSAQPMQDGHCGNFNDNPEDDTRLAIRARVGTNGVDPGELLFRTKTPVHAPNRPDLNNCPKAKADHARQVCSQKSKDGMASKECMVDVCFGGDQFAVEDNA